VKKNVNGIFLHTSPILRPPKLLKYDPRWCRLHGAGSRETLWNSGQERKKTLKLEKDLLERERLGRKKGKLLRRRKMAKNARSNRLPSWTSYFRNVTMYCCGDRFRATALPYSRAMAFVDVHVQCTVPAIKAVLCIEIN
jgi:hypothetical protein